MKFSDFNGKLIKVSLSVFVIRSNGWSNGEVIYSFRGELRDLKYNRKYFFGSDFFSRKLFKDLFCSDDMIGFFKE